MRAVARKHGNSVSVRIPAAVTKAARLRPGRSVDVRGERGRIVIEPVRDASYYEVETLVAGITGENRHDPINMGPPAGREVW